MAARYSAEHLLYLRDSPLCVRPKNLPPSEEWMGPPSDQNRAQVKQPAASRTNDSALFEQTNRRQAPDRHVSRNSANPEDLIFAPPRMAFASARGNKATDDKPSRDVDSTTRFGQRPRNGDSDAERHRDTRADGMRRRGDTDNDSEGWSTVKPRRSFGHEGAERFQGRMGGNFRDERRPAKDREERGPMRERPVLAVDPVPRDRDTADAEARTRTAPVGRSKIDSWHRHESSSDAPAPERRDRDRPDRLDRSDRPDKGRSWRDRDAAAQESLNDRGGTRTNDRRWGRDRDQRVERDPEWMDEPADKKSEAHTQQDFQKWMEQMKKAKGQAAEATAKSESRELEPKPDMAPAEARILAQIPPVQSAPAVETGPDKFFMAFGSNSGLDLASPGEPKEPASRSKPAGKSSRFTSFFSQPQDENRGRTEPPTPAVAPPPGLLGAILSQPASAVTPGGSAPPEEEKQAFQILLAKLQKQSVSSTSPGPSPFTAPPHPGQGHDASKLSNMASPEPFQQYTGGRRDGFPARPPSQQAQEILAPRPQPQTARPERLLEDLVGDHQRTSSTGSSRPELLARENSNTEFLMNLMRPHPGIQRADSYQQSQQQQPHQQPHQQAHQQPRQQAHQQLPHQQLPHQQFAPQPQGMRLGQPQKQPMQVPQLNEREHDFGGEGRPAQRHMRPQPPPGFPSMDDGVLGGPGHNARPAQPTQILQRAPMPPGLDQMPPNWMPSAGQLPPPQQRGPMMPPPGLAGGHPSRSGPMLPHMMPPTFPPGGMPPPPPEAIGGLPRNMPPPPPGFFNGPPPHGFMPPGLTGFGGPPGPDPQFPGSPYDAHPPRGMPPGGPGGRGGNYGRL